jgi:hypothetical protein
VFQQTPSLLATKSVLTGFPVSLINSTTFVSNSGLSILLVLNTPPIDKCIRVPCKMLIIRHTWQLNKDLTNAKRIENNTQSDKALGTISNGKGKGRRSHPQLIIVKQLRKAPEKMMKRSVLRENVWFASGKCWPSAFFPEKPISIDHINSSQLQVLESEEFKKAYPRSKRAFSASFSCSLRNMQEKGLIQLVRGKMTKQPQAFLVVHRESPIFGHSDSEIITYFFQSLATSARKKAQTENKSKQTKLIKSSPKESSLVTT